MPPEHAPPKQRSWRGLTCGVALGALLLPCVLLLICAVAFVPNIVSGIIGTNRAISAFCDDLKAQRYESGYGLFSPALQQQVSRDDFVALNAQQDQAVGTVRSCGVSRLAINFVNNEAIVPVQLTRARSYPGAICLLHAGGQWQIDGLDPALQLTPHETTTAGLPPTESCTASAVPTAAPPNDTGD
jgi:hypothetical protein